METASKCFSDPSGCTGHDCGFPLKIHNTNLMARVTGVIHPRKRSVHLSARLICTMSLAGGTGTSGFRTRNREELTMMETREPVITEALAVIDKALAEMLRRELVSAVEVGDLLLDLRSLLSASAATTDV
jgi:hypothetical protein